MSDGEIVDASYRESTALAVASPMLDVNAAIAASRDFERLKSALLDRARHITVISGKDYVNSAGWSVLGTALGVSMTVLSHNANGPGAVRELLEVTNGKATISYAVTVRASSPSGRHMDALGRCDSGERRHAHQSEHGLEQIACTRAQSKAIARLVGGAQGVVAEEVDNPPRPGVDVPRYRPELLMSMAAAKRVGDFRSFISRVCPSCADLDANRNLKRPLTPAESGIIYDALMEIDP